MDQLRSASKQEVETLAERFGASRTNAQPATVFASEIKVITVREQGLDSAREQEVSDADDIARLWTLTIASAPWYDPEKEHLVCFLLNTAHQLKSYALVSIGSLNESLAHTREVFRPAIAGAAASIIIAHNHPSGSAWPSLQDELLTRRLIKAGELLSLPLLDHVIIGSRDCYSFLSSTKLWCEKSVVEMKSNKAKTRPAKIASASAKRTAKAAKPARAAAKNESVSASLPSCGSS